MTPRILQNFNGGRALIITQQPCAVKTLETTLAKLGVSAEYPLIENGEVRVDFASLQPDNDILFVDSDLDNALSIEIEAVSLRPPVPLIGLIGSEAPSRLKSLINLGATAFLRKPVHGGSVYAALFLGVNQFLLRGNLQARLQEMERRRRSRRSVVKTIVSIMHRAGIDDDEAYNRIRRDSMRLRLSLEEYCEDYLRNRTDPSDSTPIDTGPDRRTRSR